MAGATPAGGVSPASAWDQPDGDIVDLPSGKRVRATGELPVYALAERDMPDELREAFNDFLGGGVEDFGLMVRLFQHMVCEIVTEPTFEVPDADGQVPDGTVPVGKLAQRDVTFLMERATGVPLADAFRAEQDGATAGGDGEDVRQPPKPAAGAPKRKPAGAKRRSKAR